MSRWTPQGLSTILGLLVVLVVLLLTGCDVPRDDSDPPEGRSGLVVFRDALTGCEYLRGGDSRTSFTPRMDASGKQVCRDGAP